MSEGWHIELIEQPDGTLKAVSVYLKNEDELDERI